MYLRRLVLGLLVVAVLAPALMITGARLLEPSGGRWVRLVSFTPHAVALYAAVLLLLLGAVVVGRGTWRYACGALCLLVVPLVALHLFWASGRYVGPRDEATGSEGRSFTVMSTNLSFGDADPVRVVELARERDADVVVMLEVPPRSLSAMREAGLEEAFPHSAGRAARGVVGTMVFSTRKLSDVTALDTRFGGLSMRVALSRGEVDLLAVHPSPPLGEAEVWAADHATVRRAAEAADGPTVIAGDFNATLDHLPMRELDGRGFRDAAAQTNAGWQPTWPASGEVSLFGVPVPPMLAIDHVLVDDGLKVLDTEAVSVPGTDHRALFATLAAS